MPHGDKTGPFGEGPMTGRKMGFCSGNDMPGYAAAGRGYQRRGRGQGGMGMQRRWRGATAYSHGSSGAVSEETLLENEARILKDQLAFVEKQLSEIKKRAD